MLDLHDQLRAYGSLVDEAVAPVGIEEAVRQTAVSQVPTSRRLHPVLIAASAAVIVLLAIGGFVLLLDHSDRPVVNSTTTLPTPTTTLAPTTTATAPTTTTASSATGGVPIALAGVSWTLVDDPALKGPGFRAIEGLAHGSSGFVGVGTECSTACGTAIEDGPGWGDYLHGAVWTSGDGDSWERVQNDPAVFETRDADVLLLDVTAWDPGFVAVGVIDYGGQAGNWQNFAFSSRNRADKDIDGAVWISTDGANWRRIDPEAMKGPGDQVVESITTTSRGLIAVGMSDHNAAVWTSTNGLTWRRVEDPDLEGAAFQEIHAVVPGGPGLVAVGEDWGLPPQDWGSRSRAAVWTSVDGSDWDRTPHDSEIFGRSTAGGKGLNQAFAMADVTNTDAGLVAVGWWETGRRPAIWTSSDGVAWSLATSDGAFHLSWDVPTAVVGNEDRFLVLSWSPESVVNTAGFPDKRQYTPIGSVVKCCMQAGSARRAGVMDGNRIIAAGWSGGDAAVWIGSIESP